MNTYRIDHLNLMTDNLAKSVDFYRDIFDLEVKEEGKSSSGLPYAIIGATNSLYLCLYESRDNLSGGPFNHLGINVENFDRFFDRLVQKNIPLLYGGVIDYPKSRSLYIQDPSGIEIEISSSFGGGLD
jgi:catechol 2,3-dioxygenase-like lactoylglutathione lyase family enzyme